MLSLSLRESLLQVRNERIRLSSASEAVKIESERVSSIFKQVNSPKVSINSNFSPNRGECSLPSHKLCLVLCLLFSNLITFSIEDLLTLLRIVLLYGIVFTHLM